MKPTPTETHCPPASNLRLLLLRKLPENEVARLQEHLRDCTACRALWQNLQTETIAAPTPPILHAAGETHPGEAVRPSSIPAVTWSSAVMLEGGGSDRAPAAPRSPS